MYIKRDSISPLWNWQRSESWQSLLARVGERPSIYWGCGGGTTRTSLCGELSGSIKVSPRRLSSFTPVNLPRRVYAHIWKMTRRQVCAERKQPKYLLTEARLNQRWFLCKGIWAAISPSTEMGRFSKYIAKGGGGKPQSTKWCVQLAVIVCMSQNDHRNPRVLPLGGTLGGHQLGVGMRPPFHYTPFCSLWVLGQGSVLSN